MANPISDVLHKLYRFAVNKVMYTDEFMEIQEVCFAFYKEIEHCNVEFFIEELYEFLQRSTCEIISLGERLKLHHILKLKVPVELRSKCKCNEEGYVEEFSDGSIRIGEPGIISILPFLDQESWNYKRETLNDAELAARYFKWRSDSFKGPVEIPYLVSKFQHMRGLIQQFGGISCYSRVRIMMWIGEPLVDETFKKELKAVGEVVLEDGKIIALITKKSPEAFTLRKDYKEITRHTEFPYDLIQRLANGMLEERLRKIQFLAPGDNDNGDDEDNDDEDEVEEDDDDVENDDNAGLIQFLF
ncbi:hypothetical protein CAEBREN_08925 [Caenorhabditis brenneri]|uniref:Uncharacterized protein n=1 Tax=Caenorhabditis brenneri TaxID=135651 RepID=G0MAX8_CAEBE|nr:hypothetical protein CAEBREN_08925 [Caenorhabditis brenneri]